MPWSILSIPLLLPGFALVLFRVGGFMMSSPIFNGSSLPVRMRAMFCIAFTMLIFPVVLPEIPAELTMHHILLGGVSELMVGVLMGLCVNVLFQSVKLAGMIIGQQAGLSIGQAYDPVTNSNSTILGQTYFIVLMLVFLLMGGLRELFAGLLDSFQMVPLMGFSTSDVHVGLIIEVLNSAYMLALKLCGPTLIAMFMATMTMGLLGRTMPQLNILSVGFAIRTSIALAIAGMTLGVSQDVMCGISFDAIEAMRAVLQLW